MSNNLFSLSGKVAAISGCTRGIGRSMAIALAEAGADVCLLQRNIDDKKLYNLITEMGRHCEIVYLDIGIQTTIQAAIDGVIAKFSRIDILVNNAGIQRRNPAVDFLEDDWDTVIQCNLKSVWTLSQTAGRFMVSQKSGKIINIASLLSFQGGINVPAYAAAKGGLALLTKALSNEWSKFNVNVNAIAPGYIATDMNIALTENEAVSEDIRNRIPAGRWGTPDDFKGPIVFLASDASNYVDGEILVVDGGWMGR
ncbi:2-deoxy-D-gluconate 3-dehydrogenase [Thamnidium elegans]|nr:2-deoxy-D-gluconate 3-dehydrogenase [Thamnidium elegans]